jgi:hypothetical protein
MQGGFGDEPEEQKAMQEGVSLLLRVVVDTEGARGEVAAPGLQPSGSQAVVSSLEKPLCHS